MWKTACHWCDDTKNIEKKKRMYQYVSFGWILFDSFLVGRMRCILYLWCANIVMAIAGVKILFYFHFFFSFPLLLLTFFPIHRFIVILWCAFFASSVFILSQSRFVYIYFTPLQWQKKKNKMYTFWSLHKKKKGKISREDLLKLFRARNKRYNYIAVFNDTKCIFGTPKDEVKSVREAANGVLRK